MHRLLAFAYIFNEHHSGGFGLELGVRPNEYSSAEPDRSDDVFMGYERSTVVDRCRQIFEEIHREGMALDGLI